jgi:YVTN family beta-propeller protein
VTNSGSGNVSVIRTADYVQTSPIAVGTDPEWIASGRSK